MLAILLSIATALATPDADTLLASVDQNMNFDSRSASLQMTVTKGKRVKVYEMESFGRGADEAAIEFEAPARDKGTRMLKRGGEMWTYFPSIEKVQKISGHMLREGLMGSNLSYEDLLETTQFRELYDATVVGEETIEGRDCWKLELAARSTDVAYPRRMSWIDKEHLVPVHEDLYASSGMMVKSWTLTEVREYEGGRKFPTRMLVVDRIQAGSQTELVFEELAFSVPLEDEVFSQRWLER